MVSSKDGVDSPAGLDISVLGNTGDCADDTDDFGDGYAGTVVWYAFE